VKIASWNVNSLRVRLPQVIDWLKTEQPDVLALQETKTTDDQFPAEAFDEIGYHVSYSGQKTYNGVAIISKQAVDDIVTDIPELDDPQRRIMAATYGQVRILDLYVVNGSEVGSDKYDYKLDWLEKVRNFIEQDKTQHEHYVVLGDFNIAPDDRDVHNPKSWHERILCSTPERNALNAILDLGFKDSFRLFDQEEKVFSWWDYRGGGFDQNMGLRIDLILSCDMLSGKCRSSIVDVEPRKLERPSDHAPVVAEFSV
jgi:exodeoxyribonuclease-3